MRNIEGILIYLLSPVLALNIDKENFKITSCQNLNTQQPEMTILFPASIIPENQRSYYRSNGKYLEMIIQENQLSMIERKERKFII